MCTHIGQPFTKAGQWDRLVISCPSFPLTYWDKFIKKKVLEKFSGSYDKDKVSDLLGLGELEISRVIMNWLIV